MKEEESYLIYNDADKINAVNGITGNIDYSGIDIAEVINNAINALPNGGLIYIKEGTYLLMSTIVIGQKISIIGSGRGTVIQRLPNISMKMIKFKIAEPIHSPGQPNVNQKVGSFSLDGNFRNGADDWAIYLGDEYRHNPDFVTFENIEIYDSDGIGFNKGCYWNRFHNVNIWYPPNKAVDLSIGSDYPNLNSFYNCRFSGSPSGKKGTGVIMHGTSNNFIMCDFSGWDIALTGSGYRHLLLSPWFELNNTMIDTTNMYQLIVINPRTNFLEKESGIIIEGKPITWIGTSAWKYGGNDQIVDTMIRTNFIDALSMPFRSFQLGYPRLVWSAVGTHENLLNGTNGAIGDDSAYRSKSIPLTITNNNAKTDPIAVPLDPPGLPHSTYITKVRIRLSNITQNSQWGLLKINYYNGVWNSIEYSIIPVDFPDTEWHEISTQFSTKNWSQFYIEIVKTGIDNIIGNVDIIQIEPGNIIGFYTPSYDIRPNGKIYLKDNIGNIRTILGKNNNTGFIGLYDSDTKNMKYAHIKSGKWIISDTEPNDN